MYAAADVKYIRKDNDNYITTPESLSKASGEAKLALAEPQVTGKAVASTNEQDAKDGNRYYVHGLALNLDLGNLPTDIVAVPGFHIPSTRPDGVEIANEWGNTASKAANGGVIFSSVPDFAANYKDFSALAGYTRFEEGAKYENSRHNWAELAKVVNRLPVLVDYYDVYAKDGNEAKTALDIAGRVVYHYPFIVLAKEAAPAAVKARAARAADEHDIVTLTMPGKALDNLSVSTEVLTAITDVEADGADAEYFNLQGIRVDNPVAGQVYLMRSNGTVRKVLMK